MTWTEHADGVFSKRYQSLDLNIGAIVCGSGLLVIDTRAHHAQARELIDDLKRVSRLPVHWVINTHHHWDHTFGNGEFADTDIWGHERCRINLADSGQSMLEKVKATAPHQAAAFDEVLIVPPNHTFEDAATVEFGTRTVEMLHLGRGHTDNDVVVRLPDAEVTFAGDLIEEGAPPSFSDAFTLEWPHTVGRMLELIDGPVIPGHGAIVDAEFVATQRDELAEVARLARQRHAEGMTVRRAVELGGPYPDDPLGWAFRRAWAQLEES
jgi:glyoxylase-like metal-dependent hydrolase (beta-lactamase superfamily II)